MLSSTNTIDSTLRTWHLWKSGTDSSCVDSIHTEHWTHKIVVGFFSSHNPHIKTIYFRTVVFSWLWRLTTIVYWTSLAQNSISYPTFLLISVWIFQQASLQLSGKLNRYTLCDETSSSSINDSKYDVAPKWVDVPFTTSGALNRKHYGSICMNDNEETETCLKHSLPQIFYFHTVCL